MRNLLIYSSRKNEGLEVNGWRDPNTIVLMPIGTSQGRKPRLVIHVSWKSDWRATVMVNQPLVNTAPRELTTLAALTATKVKAKCQIQVIRNGEEVDDSWICASPRRPLDDVVRRILLICADRCHTHFFQSFQITASGGVLLVPTKPLTSTFLTLA